MIVEIDRLRNAAAQNKALHPYHDFETLNTCRNQLVATLTFMPETAKKAELDAGLRPDPDLSMKRLIPLKVLADSEPGPPVAQHSQIAEQIRMLLDEKGMEKADYREWLSGWADELEGKQSDMSALSEII